MRKNVMKKIMSMSALALFAAVALGGCGKSEGSKDTTETTTTEVTTEVTTEATTEKATTEAELLLPVVGNDTGKVLIQTVSSSPSYKYNSYVITSVNGESIIIDGTMMPKKEVVDLKPVAILQTHGHDDHTDPLFLDSYPDVPKKLNEVGELTTNDFNIYSVQSAHMGDEIHENAGNVIIVIEVDGLRIAHMGDIGQTELTQAQLDEIGEIDIVFMQYENGYSGMTLANEMGVNLMAQLNPKIIIPTHYTPAADAVFEETYGGITQIDNILEITKEELPENTLNLYEISNTHKYR